MAKARTPEEGVPLHVRAARLIGRGRGKDIELHAPGTRPSDTGKEVMSGFRAVRKLTKRGNGDRGKR